MKLPISVLQKDAKANLQISCKDCSSKQKIALRAADTILYPHNMKAEDKISVLLPKYEFVVFVSSNL